MKPGIDPKVDYAFKWLFGKQVRESLLIRLLNAVLAPPPERTIVSLQLLNPFNDKDRLDDKLSILDIHASDQAGRRYNIEMQIQASAALVERLLYYWATMYTEQLHERDNYSKLRPTFAICFLDAVLFPSVPDHHLHFELRCAKYPHLLFSEQQEMHLIELPKFKKSENELGESIDKWCYFLIHGEAMDTEQLQESLAEVKPALEELGKFSQNDEERQRYRDRVKALRDQRSLIEEAVNEESKKARKEGREEGRQEGREEGRQEGREEGRQEGREEGKIIGRIHAFQTILKQPQTSHAELTSMTLDDLRALATALEVQATKIMGSQRG